MENGQSGPLRRLSMRRSGVQRRQDGTWRRSNGDLHGRAVEVMRANDLHPLRRTFESFRLGSNVFPLWTPRRIVLWKA